MRIPVTRHPLTVHQAIRLKTLMKAKVSATVTWPWGDSHTLVKGKLKPRNELIEAQLAVVDLKD